MSDNFILSGLYCPGKYVNVGYNNSDRIVKHKHRLIPSLYLNLVLCKIYISSRQFNFTLIPEVTVRMDNPIAR